MLKTLFHVLIFLLVSIGNATAQYSFVNYNYTNGLPLDEIKVIAEDSLGYIWLGGPLGLSRFDGSKFTHYYRDSPTDDIAGNIVNDIGVTPSGDVVVVYDDNGISIYSHQNGSFRSRNYEEDDASDFPKHSIYFVNIVNDSSAYIGANKEGLYHFNLNTLKSRKVPIDFIPNDMVANPKNEDSYFITGGGLKKINIDDYSIEKFTDQGFKIYKVIDDHIWFNAYFNHIGKFNLKTNTVTQYPTGHKGVVKGWCFEEGDLWVGTAEGLEIIDTSTSQVMRVLKAGNSARDLQGNFIYTVFKDSKNRIWVATDGGLSLYDPAKAYYESTKWLPFQSTQLDVLPNGELLSMDFYNNKLFHLDKSRKAAKIEINGYLSGPLHGLEVDGKKYVVFHNGIGIFNALNNTIDEYPCPYTEIGRRGLSQVHIHDEIWMGIYKRKNSFLTWNTQSNRVDSIELEGVPRGMLDTDDGNIWIYGVGILLKYNLKTKVPVNYPLNSNELAMLSGDIVQINKAKDDYWISSRINGVWKASYENGAFTLNKHYSASKGLTNSKIVQCYIDDDDNCYVQCSGGIFLYNKDADRFRAIGGKNEINTQTTNGITIIDGVLHALGYQNKSIDLLKVGEAQKGLKTIIEEISINGEKKNELKHVQAKFSHNENNIGISFNTFEFTDPSKIRHRYRLDSLSDWVYNGPNSGSIQFSALAAGNYLFQLSASDGDGLWTEPLEWGFSINPPYWRTWWFLLLMLGMLSLIGYSLFHFRMKQLDKVNRMKVKLAELEGESLRAQMNPHFVFNALNSIKSYIIKNRKEEAADYLTTFSELIRAVLRNSTQKEISLKNELEALTLYLQIENLRLNQPFRYKIDIAENVNPETIAFPPLVIQPFVENSIWHGFMHKKSSGNLMINIFKQGEKLLIDVIDDGVGRAKSKEIEKSRARKRSYGIAITETRLNHVANKADVKIVDLYDKDGSCNGTKVRIEVPIKFIESKSY